MHTMITKLAPVSLKSGHTTIQYVHNHSYHFCVDKYPKISRVYKYNDVIGFHKQMIIAKVYLIICALKLFRSR